MPVGDAHEGCPRAAAVNRPVRRQKENGMTRDEILAASSMPLCGRSNPKGPGRFTHHVYLLAHYAWDADAIRAMPPESLHDFLA
jgi:hypothetical protein